MSPRLLDLFCGAGGAAMGYHRAGFEVVGVDINPQPHYPFEFHQGDALEFLRPGRTWLGFTRGFDAIHASPPCQAYSRATAWSGDRSKHPDLIDPVRDLLLATGLPYVIENVQEARGRLRSALMLCGTMFDLQVTSHRYFECYPDVIAIGPATCNHQPGNFSRDHGTKQPESVFRDALGCGWMGVYEARQAIPPAYTEWIGRRALAALRTTKWVVSE